MERDGRWWFSGRALAIWCRTYPAMHGGFVAPARAFIIRRHNPAVSSMTRRKGATGTSRKFSSRGRGPVYVGRDTDPAPELSAAKHAQFEKELLHVGGVRSNNSFPTAQVSVLWFRNDLRLRDNAVLEAARASEEMLPVYCFDPRSYEDSSYGFQKTGEHRALFVWQAVKNLRRHLRDRRCDLIVRLGKPEDVLAELVSLLLERGIESVGVFAQKDVTWEETQLEKSVQAALAGLGDKVHLRFIWNSTLLDPASMPYGSLTDVPDVFSQFRRTVEQDFLIPQGLPTPAELPETPLGMEIKPGKLPELGDDLNVRNLVPGVQRPFPEPRAVMDFIGGEDAAWKRVKEWIWAQEAIATYKETRNGSGRHSDSSKFSVFLSTGCLSARDIYWEIKRFETEKVSNESTYWVIFELLWRDYFRFVAAKEGASLFSRGGKLQRDFSPVTLDAEQLQRLEQWKRGTTGVPYVDAQMRELTSTGYMSNRGRQNVASFLIHDLKVGDWRVGAEYMESKLIDYDACSNWGNWQYLAGVGNDPRGLRRFNVYKQARQYDVDADYVAKWCPELLNVPLPEIYCPHILSSEEQDLFFVKIVPADSIEDVGESVGSKEVTIPSDDGDIVLNRRILSYPAPIVDVKGYLKAAGMSRTV